MHLCLYFVSYGVLSMFLLLKYGGNTVIWPRKPKGMSKKVTGITINY